MNRSKRFQAAMMMAGLIMMFSTACSTVPANRPASGRQLPPPDVLRFENYSAGLKSNILVIDPEGRKIGYDRDYDAEVNEVPMGSYTGREEAQQVAIRNPIAGSYTFVIAGVEAGDFAAGITYGADRVVDTRDFRGQIEKGNAFFAIVELDPMSREPLQFALFQYNN